MKSATLIFPHQLFDPHPAVEEGRPVFVVEEDLFFNQYAFHKQKLVFHRASMKAYAEKLAGEGFEVRYVEAGDERADARKLVKWLREEGCAEIVYVDPTDDWLSRRLPGNGLESPLFLNSRSDLSGFFRSDKKKYHQTAFYIEQRKERGILLDEEGKPAGGDWTYDKDNRKKYPKKKVPPELHFPTSNDHYEEAKAYVEENFTDNPGSISDNPLYPVDHATSSAWLADFLKVRFEEFGPYEDAIVAEETYLHHSVLSPLINVGLLDIGEVVQKALDHAEQHGIPLNSTEGFIRQLIGWREFIRGVYEVKGREQRTRNYWGFTRKIPASFYDGSTGIVPVDTVIKRVLETGYCHHIERLMVLSNFFVLCEFDPDEVYRWFMELFIDAYDWVMVPNVYGMSQFADGGLMSTKPYISGSNYLKKMSDFPKGDWQTVWDGLFWRFIKVNRDFFEGNPRLSMMVRNLDRMGEEKLEGHLEAAEGFLEGLG